MRGAALILSFLISAVPPLRAAGAAGDYLRQDASARGAALAGAAAAITDDAASLHWNPAGLARLTKPEAQASHVTLFEDTVYDFLAGGFSSKRFGGFAVGYLRQSSGGFERRAGPNDPAVGFSIVQSAMLAGWGYTPGALPWLDFGAAVKSARESIDTLSASGTGFDLGSIVRPRPGWSLSLRAHNLIAPKLTFVSQPVSYPRILEFSAASLWRHSPQWRALVALSFAKAADENLATAGGVELQYQRLAALRFGMRGEGMSAGFGAKLGNTQVDYSAALRELGASHFVTITQRFGQTREEIEETIRRGIEKLSSADALRLSRAYQQKADTEEKDGKLSEAIRSLEAAALLDPRNAAVTRRIERLQARWDESLKRQMAERTAALADQQMELGNYLAAREYWRSVLEMLPNHPLAAARLKSIDERLSQEERTRLEGLRLAQSAGEIAQALALASSFLSRSLPRQARLEAEKILKRFPNNEQVLGFIKQAEEQVKAVVAARLADADALAKTGDLTGALKALETALREEPGHAKALERMKALREQLERKLSPEERRLIEQLYYRAVEQYLKGNFKVADDLASEVMKLDPSSQSARVLKEKVQAALRYSQ